MKNSNKIYIILLIFTLVSLFLAVFLILPLSKEIEKNSKDLISAKNNMAILLAQVDGIENFKKNYETYKPNLEKMDQLFVDPNNPVDFIKFLEDTAFSSQITSQISLPPSSQNIQKKSKGALQDFIILQFSSKGNFSEVSNFLKEIESGPYLIEIENLTIQNSQTPTSGSSKDKTVSKDYSSREVDVTLAIKVFTKK